MNIYIIMTKIEKNPLLIVEAESVKVVENGGLLMLDEKGGCLLAISQNSWENCVKTDDDLNPIGLKSALNITI